MEAWDLLAETCDTLEKYPEALEAADFALAINPKDSTALLMKANAYMHEGPISEAIEHYKQYLDMQPDDLSVMMSLAFCYNNESRHKEALSLLDKIEQQVLNMPDNNAHLSHLLLQKAYTLSHLDRFYEATNLIDNVKSFISEKDLWKCYATEGDICLITGRIKQAEEAFTVALDKCPVRVDMLFDIAISYSNAGYNNVAIELLEDVWTIYG